MNEYVEVSAGSGARLVEQASARGLEAFHRGLKIGNHESHVMQSFATLLNEFRDDRIGFGGFQKLDARFPHRKHGGVDFFDGHGFAQRHVQAELVAIELERLIDRPHRNSQMVNLWI